MAYDTKTLKRDGSGITPVPQHFNPTADDYEAILGRNGASRAELYGPDGNPISTSGGKLAVRATEIETLLNTLGGKDFATQTTLAQILAKIIAAPSTEAKQDTIIGHVDGVEGTLTALNGKDFATQTTLAAILNKIIAAPATEAKQEAIALLLSSLDGKDYSTLAQQNEILAKLAALETKLNSALDVQLSGSNMELYGATINDRPAANAVPDGATFTIVDATRNYDSWISDGLIWLEV